MPQGIQCFSDTGELSFSSDGWLYKYVGVATYQDSTPTPTGPGVAARSTYTITHAGDIICGFPVPTSANEAARIVSVSRSGNTWTIIAQAGYSSSQGPNSAGFLSERSMSIYVWGVPTTASSFGVVSYGGDSVLRADFAVSNLWAEAQVALALNATSATFPGIPNSTYPIVCATTMGHRNRTTTTGSGPFYSIQIRNDYYRWYRSGTTLIRTPVQDDYEAMTEEVDFGNSTTTTLPAQDVLLTNIQVIPV